MYQKSSESESTICRGPICIEPKHFLYNLPTFLRNVSSIAILLVCLFRELYVLCALHAELCISIQFVVFTLGGRTFSYKLEVHNVQKYTREILIPQWPLAKPSPPFPVKVDLSLKNVHGKNITQFRDTPSYIS